MNDKRTRNETKARPKTLRQAVSWALVLSSMISTPVLSAQTDISSSPITSTNAAQVRPNIMLLMDTSGSMGWGHMPDEVETQVGYGAIGYKAAQCNVLYYNRNQTYALPKQDNGTPFPTPSFTAAPYDGYAAFDSGAGTTVDLSSAFKAYDDFTLRTSGYNDTPQPAYYYYKTGGTVPIVAYNSSPCTDGDASMTVPSSDGGTWNRVVVSGAETTNFAIWYSYYRTRILLIKSAASLAFTPLTDSFRVGFITVKPKDNKTDFAINPNKYLAIDDFNTTQRGLWFAKLFSQTPGGSSPTREGLARVGRHYAGKQDGINQGMTGDPVQYSCQQNFTIMTTDGYWNAQDESTPQGSFIGGPVDMSGQSLVAGPTTNPDGSLDAPTTNFPSPPPAADFNGTPRPIWDGTFDGNRTITTKTVHYAYQPCGTYSNMSTSQRNQSTSQLLKTTSQTTQNTTQTLQATFQNLQSTTQIVATTARITQWTQQNLQSTNQNLRSTTQNLQSTSQTLMVKTHIEQTVRTPLQSTVQNLLSLNRNLQSTSQLNQQTTQNLQSTVQNLKSTHQVLQNTAQTTESTSQTLVSTSQIVISTSQLQITTSQIRRSTSQIRSCDSSTELCTPGPVGFCIPGGNITCDTVTTGPTLVVACVDDPASVANNWTATTCAATTTGPSPTGACTPAVASPGNSYTNVTCNTVPSGPTPVIGCTPAGANAGNAWTTTTCATNVTGPTPAGACAASAANGGNAYTTTTCATIATGPTAVDPASCTPQAAAAGNAWTTITCPLITTTNVPVLSCTAATGDGTNAWTTTTCPAPIDTTNVPVPACTNSAATALNAWTSTTCTNGNTTNVAVLTCTASAAAAGNAWTTTTCSTNNSALTPVQTCTPVAADISNNWTATVCPTVTTTNVPVQTCTVSGPSAGNFWTDTTCPAPFVITNQPVSVCTPQTAAAGNAWTDITCSNNNTTNVAVNSCVASGANVGNGWTTTTCPPELIDSGPTTVASCTPDPATNANGHQRTDCATVSTNSPVQAGTCVPDPPSAANGWVGTTCPTVTTANTPVLTCTPQTASAANGWVDIVCGTNNNLLVPVLSCLASGPTAANLWTTTTCPAPVTTGPTPVASCTPDPASAINVWTSTLCPAPNVTAAAGVSSCTADPPTAANSYVATLCGNVNGSGGVLSCTPDVASGSNNWTTTTCGNNDNPNVPVLTCVPSGPTSPNYITTTCSTNNTPNTGVASCSAGPATAANFWTTTTCTPNPTSTPSGSCVPSGPNAGNGFTTTTCPQINIGPAGASSCTPATGDGTNAWTTTTCPGTATTGPTPVASCTNASADSTNAWTATTCSTATTGPTVVTTCNPGVANAGNNFTTTTCVHVDGDQLATTTFTRVQQFPVSGGVQSGPGTDVTTADGPNTSGACYAPGTQPALPVDGIATWTPGDAVTYPSCSAWPCTVNVNTDDPRSLNSLADVAQYYYVNDLRTPANEPRGPAYYQDDVPAVGSGPEDDKARWQHMTTFSIALGISGTIKYVSDYKTSSVSGATDSPPDIRFADIRCAPPHDQNTCMNWPLWPDPTPGYYADPTAYNDPRSIDDFWHAAVNGRGTYFSASNPTSVIAGLAGALAGITARVASSTGAGTSNLEPVPGDNFVYLANYSTQKWTGDVQAHEIDVNTGIVQAPVIWSAQSLLDTVVGNACDNRTIKLFRAGATNNLVNFTWNTQACDITGSPTGAPDTGLNAAEQANFNATNVSLLSQYPSMTDGTLATVDQRTPAPGANLVNFLRGQRGLEDFTAGVAGKLYRKRDHVLGDIVNGQPVYVRAPFASYADPGYAAFKTANAGRLPMLYVPSNDGMLHAFYAGTTLVDPLGGKEAWAIIPSSVLPKLYTLADANYQNIHQYFVDGTPSVSDVYDGSNWKTVLVGGLNDGGRSFYALDVTDPVNPKGMWEFSWSDTCYDPATPSTAAADCQLGLSFGHPLISKLSDGRWVVMVTSGYNNVNATPKAGDGVGYLYVLDALTGQIIYKIPTGVGDPTTPSGLAQINNFVDKAEINNLTVRVYGTDVLGNIWRFDVNDNTPPSGREATLVGTATDAGGTPQPITTRAELTQVGDLPMLFVATGKLLGATDVADVQAQTIYGVIDPVVGSTAYANLRAALAPLTMTQIGSGTGATRTINCTGTSAQCASTNGWRVDLPDVGERVNVEMKLRANTLIVGSNVPQISACSAGGYSWLNYLNYKSGLAVIGAPGLSVSEQVANSLIVGLTVIKLTDGTYKAIVTTSDAGVLTRNVPTFTQPQTAKRVSWREVLAP